MIDLSVIIVSFNTKKLLNNCLESAQRGLTDSSMESEIIVIDNNSQDGSVEIIKRNKVILIENKKNVGFGRANNQGARMAKGKYLLFLNSDTLIEKKTLEKMVKFLDRNPDAGIASCQLKNKDGNVQFQGGDLPRLSTVAVWALFLDDLPVLHRLLPSYQLRKEIKKVQEVGWVSGAAMFMRRKCWDEISGFDENLFMYGEDVELCYRAKKNGWRVMINPEASIIHLGKGSGGGRTGWVIGEIKGLLYLFTKHKPAWELPILKLILKLGMRVRWFVFGILGRNEQLCRAYKESCLLA